MPAQPGLVPTYFSAQILCAFPSRNITSTTTAKCLHCLHWLQCLQSTTLHCLLPFSRVCVHFDLFSPKQTIFRLCPLNIINSLKKGAPLMRHLDMTFFKQFFPIMELHRIKSALLNYVTTLHYFSLIISCFSMKSFLICVASLFCRHHTKQRSLNLLGTAWTESADVDVLPSQTQLSRCSDALSRVSLLQTFNC